MSDILPNGVVDRRFARRAAVLSTEEANTSPSNKKDVWCLNIILEIGDGLFLAYV